MGKRSNFKRIARDAYDTPLEAVEPLLSHLAPGTEFSEPCAGSGLLASHLENAGHRAVTMFDIEPRSLFVAALDVFESTDTHVAAARCVITNPPWSRDFLHPFIEHCMLEYKLPAWLLLDADWMHTKQASPYLKYCARIVSVGRVKWMPGTNMTSKDNCCWYKFTPQSRSKLAAKTIFYGRKV